MKTVRFLIHALCWLQVCAWAQPPGERSAPGPATRVEPGVYESGIAALVNREVITEAEVREQMRLAGPLGRTKASELRKFTLLRMIQDRVMDQAVGRLHLVLNPQQIKTYVEREKEEAGGEEAFNEALMDKGVSYEQHVNELTAMSRRHLYLSSFAGGANLGEVLRPEHSIEPTAREIRQYYESHRQDKEFSSAARAHVWYMAISVSSTATPTEPGSKKKALEKASRIRDDLMTGADFATLARLHSPLTADSGGDMGWHGEDSSLNEEVLAYAFSAPPGGVSEPIEIRSGYLLVRVSEREEAREVPFAEAQVTIRDRIREERRNRAIAKVRARLIREAYIWPDEFKGALLLAAEEAARK